MCVCICVKYNDTPKLVDHINLLKGKLNNISELHSRIHGSVIQVSPLMEWEIDVQRKDGTCSNGRKLVVELR